MLPSTGMRRRKESTVGKKPANSSQKPYASTAMPTIAQPHTTSATPPRKKAEPCAGGVSALLGARPTERQGSAQRAVPAPLWKRQLLALATQAAEDTRWQTDPVRTLNLQLTAVSGDVCFLCCTITGKVAGSARAFRFFLLMKKRRVACGPIVSDTPARNISCPRTSCFSGTHNAPGLSKAGLGCVE